MRLLLQQYGKLLFALESRRPLSDFDTLGFSLTYELGATNVLEMLKLSEIPVTTKVVIHKPVYSTVLTLAEAVMWPGFCPI